MLGRGTACTDDSFGSELEGSSSAVGMNPLAVAKAATAAATNTPRPIGLAAGGRRRHRSRIGRGERCRIGDLRRGRASAGPLRARDGQTATIATPSRASNNRCSGGSVSRSIGPGRGRPPGRAAACPCPASRASPDRWTWAPPVPSGRSPAWSPSWSGTVPRTATSWLATTKQWCGQPDAPTVTAMAPAPEASAGSCTATVWTAPTTSPGPSATTRRPRRATRSRSRWRPGRRRGRRGQPAWPRRVDDSTGRGPDVVRDGAW